MSSSIPHKNPLTFLLSAPQGVTLSSNVAMVRTKRAHSCHVNIDTRTFSRKKVDLQISADASEPVLGTSFGCAQVWHDFRSLKMFKSSQTVYS